MSTDITSLQMSIFITFFMQTNQQTNKQTDRQQIQTDMVGLTWGGYYVSHFTIRGYNSLSPFEAIQQKTFQIYSSCWHHHSSSAVFQAVLSLVIPSFAHVCHNYSKPIFIFSYFFLHVWITGWNQKTDFAASSFYAEFFLCPLSGLKKKSTEIWFFSPQNIFQHYSCFLPTTLLSLANMVI